MKPFILFLSVLLFNAVSISAQNVGIGTANPTAKLEVVGAGTGSGTNVMMLKNSNGDTLLRMRGDGRVGIAHNGSTYGRTLSVGGTGINIYSPNAAFAGALNPTDTSLTIFSNNGANNYLVLQPQWGNTGIGTFSPNAKLHLNGAQLIGNNTQRIATGYSLSVDGRIMSEESTVLNSTSWPDYVFDNNYKLMPLYDLEKKIGELKHLPNVPSAEEIEKNGIELGKMSNIQMEKIEELTLYIIQLKKEIDELSAEVKKCGAGK